MSFNNNKPKKRPGGDRYDEMYKQQELIEKKKQEIQAKIEEKKRQDTEDALKKLGHNMNSKPLLNTRKNMHSRFMSYKNNRVQEDPPKPVLPNNIFSNDGSFLQQFHKLSGIRAPKLKKTMSENEEEKSDSDATNADTKTENETEIKKEEDTGDVEIQGEPMGPHPETPVQFQVSVSMITVPSLVLSTSQTLIPLPSVIIHSSSPPSIPPPPPLHPPNIPPPGPLHAPSIPPPSPLQPHAIPPPTPLQPYTIPPPSPLQPHSIPPPPAPPPPLLPNLSQPPPQVLPPGPPPMMSMHLPPPPPMSIPPPSLPNTSIPPPTPLPNLSVAPPLPGGFLPHGPPPPLVPPPSALTMVPPPTSSAPPPPISMVPPPSLTSAPPPLPPNLSSLPPSSSGPPPMCVPPPTLTYASSNLQPPHSYANTSQPPFNAPSFVTSQHQAFPGVSPSFVSSSMQQSYPPTSLHQQQRAPFNMDSQQNRFSMDKPPGSFGSLEPAQNKYSFPPPPCGIRDNGPPLPGPVPGSHVGVDKGEAALLNIVNSTPALSFLQDPTNPRYHEFNEMISDVRSRASEGERDMSERDRDRSERETGRTRFNERDSSGYGGDSSRERERDSYDPSRVRERENSARESENADYSRDRDSYGSSRERQRDAFGPSRDREGDFGPSSSDADGEGRRDRPGGRSERDRNSGRSRFGEKDRDYGQSRDEDTYGRGRERDRDESYGQSSERDSYRSNEQERDGGDSSRRQESTEERSERRARKRKSRWGGDDASQSGASMGLRGGGAPPLPSHPPPPGIALPLALGQPVPLPQNTINVPGMHGPAISQVGRTDPALLAYARQAFGSTNLSEEDWKKAEDHYKINLLYHDMLRKRQELERLQRRGRHKYEYDSDEETEGGTWEHKLRTQEMEATQVWADELTEKCRGKHHIGDFLPPDELERFMEKYNALKEGREPDLSDYKEFKLKEDNIGFQMLQKLGWTEGSGLGQDGAGIQEPVNKASTRIDNQGLGVERPADLAGQDDEFDAYRKRMMLAYRFRPNPLNNPRRPYY